MFCNVNKLQWHKQMFSSLFWGVGGGQRVEVGMQVVMRVFKWSATVAYRIFLDKLIACQIAGNGLSLVFLALCFSSYYFQGFFSLPTWHENDEVGDETIFGSLGISTLHWFNTQCTDKLCNFYT